MKDNSTPIDLKPTLNSTRLIDNEIVKIQQSKFDPIQQIQEAKGTRGIYIIATKASLDVDKNVKLYKDLKSAESVQIKTPRAKIAITKEYQEQKLLKPTIEIPYVNLTREVKEYDEPIVPQLIHNRVYKKPILQFSSIESTLEQSRILAKRLL